MNHPTHLRASFDDRSVTMYQAYSPAIASFAVRAGTFVPPFRRDRMTWIKPSFLWLMHRSSWATAPDQERILAIRLRRDGFETALAEGWLTKFDSAVYSSESEWQRLKAEADVRIQWDPDRNLMLEPVARRAIQIGLRRTALDRYVDSWILTIADVTPRAHAIREMVDSGDLDGAQRALPAELPYPLAPDLARHIGCRSNDLFISRANCPPDTAE